VFSEKSLKLAWERYRRLSKDSRKDYFGLNIFDIDLENNLSILSKKLMNHDYLQKRPLKIYQPKKSGLLRTLTVFEIEEALIYQCISDYIGSVVYNIISVNYEDIVFGSLLNSNVERWISILDEPDPDFYFFKYYAPLYSKFTEKVNTAIENDQCRFKLETDITNFYDCIPHALLYEKLVNTYSLDQEIIKFLFECLNSWNGSINPTPNVGIPQTSIGSPLLANIYLHELDENIKKKGLNYTRYMDDMRIYGYTADEMQELMVEFDFHIKELGLSLNSGKTYVDKVKEREKIYFDYQPIESIDQIENKLYFDDLSDQLGQQEVINPKVVYETSRGVLQDSYTLVQDYIPEGPEDLDPITKERMLFSEITKFRWALGCLEDDDLFDSDWLAKKYPHDLWINCAENYYWNTDKICWVLKLYKNNDDLKNDIYSKIIKFKRYDWVVAQLYTALSEQNFNKHELVELLSEVQKEIPWYVKIELYLLLIKKADSKSFFNSITHNLSEEILPIKQNIVSQIIKLNTPENELNIDFIKLYKILY